MKDLHTVPNENLEARITAWVLGEASPFEAAELEVICAADPELQLFLNRTKAIHSLLLETPPSSSDQFWKLSPNKREKLDPIIGPKNSSRADKNSVNPRATYRTIFGIAAVLTVTLFIKQFIFSPTKELPLTMASENPELNSEMPATRGMKIDSLNEDLAYQEKNSGLSSPAAKVTVPAEEAKREVDNSIANLQKGKLPPDDTVAHSRATAFSEGSMDLAKGKDSYMRRKSASGAGLSGGGGEEAGENLPTPAPASDASALPDQLALNEGPLKKESLYQSDAENTSEKKTSSAIVPVVPSIAAAPSATSTLKISPPTDATAGSSTDAFAAPAQTDEDKATSELNRDATSDAAISAKSPESNRQLEIGQPIAGESSTESLNTAAKQDDIRKDPAPEKRELISSHSTVAKFIGIKDHRCMGRTSSCPDRCGHSGKLATFEIIEYLDYQKPGEYGDPKQTTFQVLIKDNQEKAKIPAEILAVIESLKPDTKVKLSWNHDYVTKGILSSPERPITKIEADQ
jgi:hypothetical protein